MRGIDNFYQSKDEPHRSCLLAMRGIILSMNENITEAWKYKMPFFCYKGKMFCYLWTHKKTLQPYLGIVEGKKINHPLLIIENRSRMKIMMLDSSKDIPVKTIKKILDEVLTLYQGGTVKARQ